MAKVSQLADASKSADVADDKIDPSRPAAGLTVGEHERLVERVVRRVIAAQAERPRLVDDRAAAQAIDVSPGYMARLAREGAPHVIVGERRRWDIDRLVAWFAARSASGEG